MGKEEKEKQETVKEKKSFKETVILMFRKKWLTNTTQTALLVAILVATFIGINLYIRNYAELPEIDVTENKIYTLSDASKDAVSKIDENVKMYVYGFEENSSIISFIKQYTKANEHLSYEFLTEQSNLAKVQEYELSEGYQIIILETETSSKIIDSKEFYSYDYTTGQEVDLTEQTLTNSLLSITTENKPKVYFTTGHDEYSIEEDLGVLNTYLKNESYIVSTVNLLTTGKVPDDCNLLMLMAPYKDLVEIEVNAILDYINKGGDLIITSDVGNITEGYANLQKIYDQFGVTLNHSGYVYETASNKMLSNYPSIFMPEVSASNSITADIYTDGAIWLAYSGRLNFASEEQLTALNVTREDILTSSENALFITDISQNSAAAAETAEQGKSIIASVLTKTITPAVEASSGLESQDAVESKLMIMASSNFITDYVIEQLSPTYPISYLANNKDFMLNAISSLTYREHTLKIRKDMATSTYTPTAEQHAMVLLIIFAVPIVIILTGIVVWNFRRRKR